MPQIEATVGRQVEVSRISTDRNIERTQRSAAALADAARRGAAAVRITDGSVWWQLPDPEDLQDPSRSNTATSGILSIPDWVYFVGPWYRLDYNLLRQLLLYDISRLGLRLGSSWFLVPIPLRSIRAVYFRLRPLILCLRWIVGRTQKARRIAARLVLGARPPAAESAADISGPAGIANPNLQGLFDAILSQRADKRDAVPRRIVQVCGSLQPGGAERQVAYTVRGLGQSDVESVQLLCHFLTPGGAHHYDFYLSLLAATKSPVREIRRRSKFPELFGLPAQVGSLLRLLPQGLATDVADLYLEFLDLRPNVVHAWLDWDNVRAGIAAVLAGVPKIILSGRNLNPTHFTLYQSYMDPAYRALARMPNITLINNSRAGADSYADWIGVPRARIDVVYNAVALPDAPRPGPDDARSIRRSLGIKPEAFLVGGVFRLCEVKRPLLWIETASLVGQRIPEAQFIVFGSGNMEYEVQAAIRRANLDKRVVLAGVNTNISAAMSVMDAVLLTSHGEGLPNVLLEAQSAGTPVVATAVGGVSEAVADSVTGWAVKSDSPHELAERLIWLHAHADFRAAATRKGPQFIRSKFGTDRMIEQVMGLYGLAAKRNSCPE